MRQWTAEERARQAELIKQWQPWTHSTGATTPEGKAVARMNARKHGLYSAEIKALRQAMREQMQALAEEYL